MRISEVTSLADVSAATFKYYIREGLVPEGDRVGANRTEYTPDHVRRVRLVRALLDTGKLSITAAREVLAAVDSSAEFGPAFQAAQHALDGGRPPGSADSRARIAALVAEQGWITNGQNPGVEAAARALDGFAATGSLPTDKYLSAYAQAAGQLASADLAAIAELAERDGSDAVVELMVVGTVMGDALVSSLRRIAQEHESAHASAEQIAEASAASTTRSTTRKDTP